MKALTRRNKMKYLEGHTPVDYMISDPDYTEALMELQNAIDQAAAEQEENYEGGQE